ncbi:hypothetical protein [Pseudonocardia abyssalis]|uniref:Uncharacterized protein n=1 Tax=Pseudonocardia abyssalis TaxID=2792008 RepID=A0ABS6V0G5_9PSEU|nr:hypothetical protein [Pseudonocardia abyssalis]MBW0116109.1 hypothetical protein [Pseudonocardia abyssalis]MBW0137897.1 hypothetical protein [Pseudonocardia abyssalis]
MTDTAPTGVTTRRRVGPVVAVAAPGLVLAVAGLFHPRALAPSTATLWWNLHVVLLPLFPLLAVALWVLLRGERGVLAWLARIAAYGYAAFYTALDVLAGIGAGYLVDEARGGSQEANDLRALGNDLGMIGSWSFLVATVLVGVLLVRRDGRAALPGAVILFGGAANFLHGHIYWPSGGLAVLAIGVGCGALAYAARPA